MFSVTNNKNMDRRKFLKASLVTLAASQIAMLETKASSLMQTTSNSKPALPAKVSPSEKRINIKFLGTGAADWKGPDKRGEHRRLSSVLVGGKFLIDYTSSAADMIPEGCKPEVIFYTHSHGDHYEPSAALRLGIRKVYVSVSWVERARRDFAKAASKLGVAEPEIIPLGIGDRVLESGLVLTALTANHATWDKNEQTLIYMIESKDARILYATDTGGLTGVSSHVGGFDKSQHGDKKKVLSGLIMEATMGLGHEDDFRIFTHSSVATVAQTVRVLQATGRLIPKTENFVYLTHMARTLHPTQAELEATLPAPLKAAYDGLEVIF